MKATIIALDAVANVIIRSETGDGNTSVQKATIVGQNAVRANMTTGANGTTAIGANSLQALVGGGESTAVGFEAGKALVGGAGNTMLGYQALLTEDGHGTNTAIGDQA